MHRRVWKLKMKVNNTIKNCIIVFQITIFQERYLRLAMVITINEYCAVDNYSRTVDCGLTDR